MPSYWQKRYNVSMPDWKAICSKPEIFRKTIDNILKNNTFILHCNKIASS